MTAELDGEPIGASSMESRVCSGCSRPGAIAPEGLTADRPGIIDSRRSAFGVLNRAASDLLVRLRRVAALAGRGRRIWINHRRRGDRLCAGFASTWPDRQFNAAAEITDGARRVMVKLIASWPYADEYRRISQAVLAWPRTS